MIPQKFKGTSGQWTSDDSICSVTQQRVINISSSHIEEFAVCYTGTDIEDGIDDETRANANLIQTSPEMISTLLKIKEVLSKQLSDVEYHAFDLEVGLSGVINKALGTPQIGNQHPIK